MYTPEEAQGLLNDLTAPTSQGKCHRYIEEHGVNPLAYKLYMDFIATGKFPYLAEVTEFALKSLPELSPQQKANLTTQMYFASSKRRAEEAKAKSEKLQAQGWTPIYTEFGKRVREASEKGMWIEIYRETSGLLSSGDTREIYKPFVRPGEEWLMKPKSRTRGIQAYTFELMFQGSEFPAHFRFVAK